MAVARPPLLTARFIALCCVHFAAAAASFQLFPAVPFRIRELGGSTAASGLFLGVLTYGSALSAPWTGGLADLLGRRRLLLVASSLLALFGLVYALVPSWIVMVCIALPHGLIWSVLLTSSAAYATDLIPAERRGEGIAYHGMGPTLAFAIAPSLGFWLAARGWTWLCASIVALDLVAVGLAFRLPDTTPGTSFRDLARLREQRVEWGVLALSGTLFLVSLGYGGVISFVAQMAEARGIAPKGIFFTAFAATILVSRPLLGRLIDQVGARRAIPACVVGIVAGLALLPLARSAWEMAAAAVVFGAGFATYYPAFSTFVLDRVGADRRGAAFGAMLAAFDSGIGTGSIVLGPVIQRFGFGVAWSAAAVLSLGAWPYFRVGERRWSRELARRDGEARIAGGGAGLEDPSAGLL